MLEGIDGFTGVVEDLDIAATLNLMLGLHPNATRIAVIGDRSATGRADRNALDEVIRNYSRISFEFIDNVTVDGLQERISSLPDDSLILLMTFIRDSLGDTLSGEECAELVRSSSRVPAYGIWDFQLGHGVVGGKLISGSSQGTAAADIAIRILNGESPDRIPTVRTIPGRYMFDMLELARFGIDPSNLPEGCIIINSPLKTGPIYGE